jgi:hypothetical protein
MSFVSALNKNGYHKPVWTELAAGFPEDRDCLAAFIALEAAEVLDGVKPSNLINVPVKLAEAYRQCRSRMAGRLVSGCVPYECLGVTNRAAVPKDGEFFIQ